MTLSALAIIGATIVLSSFISGVFGMAGGMVLLGVLLVFLDVASAMILFSIIQFFANASRTLHWWRFVRWRIFLLYAVGSLIAFAFMRLVAFIPDKALVYFVLGLMPFAVEALPQSWRPNIEWRGVPVFTGAVTTIVQFLSGVGGLLLDLFFQKSMLDRKTTLATKGITQTYSHVLRALYFGSFGGSIGDIAGWQIAAAIVLAVAGTSLAPFVIERMTDNVFRQWTRRVIFVICTVYLVRAVWLYWQG
jgi:uncharacterized protein